METSRGRKFWVKLGLYVGAPLLVGIIVSLLFLTEMPWWMQLLYGPEQEPQQQAQADTGEPEPVIDAQTGAESVVVTPEAQIPSVDDQQEYPEVVASVPTDIEIAESASPWSTDLLAPPEGAFQAAEALRGILVEGAATTAAVSPMSGPPFSGSASLVSTRIRLHGAGTSSLLLTSGTPAISVADAQRILIQEAAATDILNPSGSTPYMEAKPHVLVEGALTTSLLSLTEPDLDD